MVIININLKDTPENMQLANDVVLNRKKLAARGSMLNARMISLLERNGVNTVSVYKDEYEKRITTNLEKYDDNSNNASNSSVSNNTSAVNSISEPHLFINLHDSYLQILSYLDIERRYGRLAQKTENLYYTQQLFQKYMRNETYHYYLKAMYKSDIDTFNHMVDVFTLGTIILRELHIENCDEIALGFLMHDIGKLKVPIQILRKQSNLTDEEFEVIRKHTTEGQQLLEHIGAKNIAYMARSHHERNDGSGYPDQKKLQEFPQELAILRMVDMYSAITMKRSYSPAQPAPKAIGIMFRDQEAIDEYLLKQFVDLLGIYPENALVLLSNGYQAIVEDVNEQYPLLPKVSILEENKVLNLPMDFRLTISKLISYQAVTEDQLFKKLSEFLINLDFQSVEKYYTELKGRLHRNKWFTHLYIPMYQVFKVLLSHNMISETQMNKSVAYFSILIEQTILQYRLSNTHADNVLIILDRANVHPVAIQILEGVFHSSGLYPIIINGKMSDEIIQHQIEVANILHIYLIGIDYLPVLGLTKKSEVYNLDDTALENVLSHYSKKDLNTIDVLEVTRPYKYFQKLLK